MTTLSNPQRAVLARIDKRGSVEVGEGALTLPGPPHRRDRVTPRPLHALARKGCISLELVRGSGKRGIPYSDEEVDRQLLGGEFDWRLVGTRLSPI